MAMLSMASLPSTTFSLHSHRFPPLNPMPIYPSIPSIVIRFTPLSIPLSKCSYVVSSSTSIQDQDDDNVIAEFLVNECGFSPPEVSRVIKGRSSLSRTRSTHTARNVVELLRDCGFTATQLKNTILRNPSVLHLKAHEQIKPKIEFFQTLGFTKQDLGSVISRAPRLLGMSLENNLATKIPFLENLFGSKENLSKALRRSTVLLTADLEKNIKPKLELLQQSGVEDKLLLHLVNRAPRLLGNSAESLKLKIEHVKKMGILEGSKTFTYALYMVTCNGPENIDKKLKLMERLGLSEDEIRQLVCKAPLVLNFSTNKLENNMDFLTQTAGLPPSVVVNYPYLLGYSVEKRFKPRYEAFKALVAGLHDEQPISLPNVLNVGEKAFLNIIERSPEAARIHRMYRSKSIT